MGVISAFDFKNMKKNPLNARFSKRLSAFLIDMLIVNFIILSQFTGIYKSYFDNISFKEIFTATAAIPAGAYWITFFMMVLVLLYFSFFDYYLGQTPGKMIMKIKVVSVKDDDSGSKKSKKQEEIQNTDITLWRAIVRSCYLLPFFPFSVFVIADIIFLSIYNERFLEKITDTRTVEIRDKDSGKNNYYKEYKLSKA